MNKIAIYTANIRGKDRLLDPLEIVPGADYFLFSNRREYPKYHQFISYNAQRIYTENNWNNSTLQARCCKHVKFFTNHKIWIWVDCNIHQIKDFTPLINKFIETDSDIGMFSHFRKNIYDERAELIRLYQNNGVFKNDPNIGNILKINSLFEKYEEEGFTNIPGLWWSAIYLRKNCEKVIKAEKEIWNLLRDYAPRDQIIIPYIIKKYDLKVCTFGKEVLMGKTTYLDDSVFQTYFRYYRHLR